MGSEVLESIEMIHLYSLPNKCKPASIYSWQMNPNQGNPTSHKQYHISRSHMESEFVSRRLINQNHLRIWSRKLCKCFLATFSTENCTGVSLVYEVFCTYRQLCCFWHQLFHEMYVLLLSTALSSDAKC